MSDHQYQISTDARSGLRHDPNDLEHPVAIAELGERVSVDTMELIAGLPALSNEV